MCYDSNRNIFLDRVMTNIISDTMSEQIAVELIFCKATYI